MNFSKDIESFLKGRIAETLFEELMQNSGHAVYRFGYEAVIQNLTQLDKHFDKSSEVGERIEAIPDFLVLIDKTKPVFVEVKFRWDGELWPKDQRRLENLSKYWGAKFVLVRRKPNPPYFFISDPPYVKDGKLVARPLLAEVGWVINREEYKKCEDLIRRYCAHLRPADSDYCYIETEKNESNNRRSADAR